MSRFSTELRRAKSRLSNSVMGRLRERLLRTVVVLGDPSRVHVDPTAVCQDALFNARSGPISVGAGTFFGHGVMVLTGTHQLDGDPSERQAAIPSDGHGIHIGKNVWVGSGAILIGPLCIADGAVIGAGAVVRDDVPAYTTVAGVPARPVAARHPAS